MVDVRRRYADLNARNGGINGSVWYVSSTLKENATTLLNEPHVLLGTSAKTDIRTLLASAERTSCRHGAPVEL